MCPVRPLHASASADLEMALTLLLFNPVHLMGGILMSMISMLYPLHASALANLCKAEVELVWENLGV